MNIRLLIRLSVIKLLFKISTIIRILLLTGYITALICSGSIYLWVCLIVLTFSSDMSGRCKVVVIYIAFYGV